MGRTPATGPSSSEYRIGGVMAAEGGAPRGRDVADAAEVASESRDEGERSPVARDWGRSLAQTPSGFAFALDADGALTWVASDVTAVLGWSPQDLVGTPIADLVHSQDRAAAVAEWERILGGRGPARRPGGFVMRVRSKAGEYRWMDWGQARASDTGGHPPGLVASLRDFDELTRARQGLDAERTRLRATLDSLLDPHVLLQAVRNESGVIVDFVYAEANAAACDYNGVKYQDLVGAQLLDLLPGHVASGLLEQYTQVAETGVPLVLDDFAYKQELLGGVQRFYDIRAVRIGDGLSYTWRDVTDRHRAAEQIAGAEARYRLLAENATGVVVLIDLQWTLKWVSPATEDVLGYDPASLVGMNTADLIHPDDLPVLAALRDTPVDDRVGVPYQVRVRNAAGGFRWMSGVSRAVLDADGNVAGRMSTLRDVHEQVLAEQALARSEARYRMLAENASDVVAQVDADNTIAWVSPSAQRVLGWLPGQLVGTSVVDVTHPDDREAGHRWRLGMRAGATQAAMELRVLTGDGGYRWMSVTAHPLSTADGSVTGRVVGLRDVHEQVLARQALVNSQRRYRMLAENASDVVWHLDTDTVLHWVAPSIESVLGWAPDDLLGKPAIDLVHPEDLPALQQWRTAVFAGTTVRPFELRVRKSDGDFRWMSLQTRPITDAGGSVSGAVVALRDVHEQVIARENLARSEATLRLAMAGAPQGIAAVGLHLAYLKVNAALCTMLGRNEAWMLSHTVRDVLAPESVETDLAVRDRLLRGEVEFDIHEVRMLTASGVALWVQHSIALVRDEHNMPLFYVSQYQDITGERATKQDLQYRAEHDTLTGLINRGELQERLADVLDRRQRAAGVPGLLFCDLDHFKTINDTYGHAAGDYVLRVTAERIASALRDDDEIARLGGDEFVVVLPEVSDVRSAILVAEKVRAAVAQPFRLGKGEMTITMSVGVALATPGIEARRLLRNADSALYEAKNAGRDRIVVFDRDPHPGGGPS
ncbi:MAG: PAS domain S-box protein [Actinomycetes bacterium]